MKILILGGGGREHALAWRLAKSPGTKGIWACPGNPGIAQVATCVPVPQPASNAAYADLAVSLGIDLTIVGPEAPLVAGVVDEFRARRLRIVGPTQAAARLEGSKIFAKQFFERANIPTARSTQVSSVEAGLASFRNFGLPVVIKADGLAAGKGVVIAATETEAEEAIRKLGPSLVIEEFLEGEEVSYIGVSDGNLIVPFAPSQDHKRVFDGDQGPNTGGMGAYADTRILTDSQADTILESIMLPTLHTMRTDGTPFTGFLYAGLMMTAAGPKILEFNVRMGDPETQAIMHSYSGDFLELLAMLSGAGGRLQRTPPSTPSVCITLAAKGYPETPQTGEFVSGITDAEATGATVFHAGTKMDGSRLVTAGGRVLSVTAGGETLPQAIENAYRAAHLVHFDGMQYRRDIGQKGLKRWQKNL